ncbi:hypothetical protein [Ruegeria arenilitoris]|uniref:hypothetical protein n=1 Tax=Ruegeria arenilitoris TaxID=1173585 RepID=UPI0014814DB4|nr:hypothetical protein [Ruegeria arenilitoris]
MLLHIQLMNPDVIAIQEIYEMNYDSDIRTNEVLDRALAIVSGLPIISSEFSGEQAFGAGHGEE